MEAPLRHLTQATTAVAEGNLSVRVPVKSSDEIGQLGLAFNDMAHRDRAWKAFRTDQERLRAFAETEREFISIRTKQGLAAARAKGKMLGRPKGSRDKHRVLDPYRNRIRELLELKMPLLRISSILNDQMEKPLSYNSYQYFVRQDPELLALWQAQQTSDPNP